MIANCSMAHLEPFSCPTSWVQSDDATHSHLASTPQEDCSGFDEWHTVPLPSFVQSWQDEAQHQHDAVKGRHWKSVLAYEVSPSPVAGAVTQVAWRQASSGSNSCGLTD
eukprot:1801669-Rhodomonas_salina.1